MRNNLKSIPVVIASALLLVGCATDSPKIEKLTNYFNKSVPLLCSVSPYRYEEHILVSKKSGYTIYKKDFLKKGDSVLFIKSCKTVDEIRR